MFDYEIDAQSIFKDIARKNGGILKTCLRKKSMFSYASNFSRDPRVLHQSKKVKFVPKYREVFSWLWGEIRN